MKTRIVESYNQGVTWFTPQWSVDGDTWMEFFGFDSHSPYLHVKSFQSVAACKSFLENPAIISGKVIWASK